MTNDFAHRYLVHGVRILSVVELPELDRTQKPRLNEGDEAQLTREALKVTRMSSAVPRDNLVKWLTRRDARMRLGSHNDDWVLCFPSGASYVLSRNLREIVITSNTTVDEEIIRLHLLHHVIPHALALRGHLMFHAAAVVMQDQAVLFVGSSGAGKSTLTSGLALGGLHFLSDDMVRVITRAHRSNNDEHSDIGVQVLPSIPIPRVSLRPFQSHSGVWPLVSSLLDRHRERLDERIRVPELGAYAQQTAKRLKAVYVLQPSRFTEAQFVELAPVQSLQALAAATYFASPHAKVEWWGKLDDMNSVVEAVPFHAVQYRRTASGLPALLSRIIEHASGVTQRSI